MDLVNHPDVTLSGRRFADQLVRSHLQVASIGLLVVLIALIAIFFLYNKVNTVIQEWEPIDRASAQILIKVYSSMAGLRGWVVLKNQANLYEWKSAWLNGIEPSLAELQQRMRVLNDTKNIQILEQLQPLLRKFYIYQWQAQDVAPTIGNEPARVIFLKDLEPLLNELESLLQSLSKAYDNPKIVNHHDHLVLMGINNTYTASRIALNAFINYGLLHDELQFWSLFHESRDQLEQWAGHLPQQTQELRHIVLTIKKMFEVVAGLARDVIAVRLSDQWNVAQSMIRTRTTPVANKVLATIEQLLSHSRHMMDQYADEAALIFRVTMLLLLVLVVGMILLAVWLAKRRSLLLTEPVWNLVQGAQAFSLGHLNQDIPITCDNELGLLTDAFNKMRFSVHHSHQALATSNTLLAQRAEELSQTNKDLRDFGNYSAHPTAIV